MIQLTNFPYEFKDKALLRQALTHRSAKGPNNERLEFLGDSHLGAYVAYKLYTMFPKDDEGVLSRKKAILVRKTSLAKFSQKWDVRSNLLVGPGEAKAPMTDSKLEDAVEAIIGAALLDGGVNAANQVCDNLLDGEFSQSNWDAMKDNKTKLQEYLQEHRKPLPKYIVNSIDGPAHNQQFTVMCSSCLGSFKGVGSNRRLAEQEAAKAALKHTLSN